MASDYGMDVVHDEPEIGALPQEQEPEEQSGPSYTVWDSIGKDDLTSFFSETKLNEIGFQVVKDYDADMAAFEPRKARIEELYKLALQAKEAKNYPFEGASNIKYPLLTKAAIGFASLAYPALVQDDQVVKGKAVGNDEGDEVVKGSDGQPLINPDTGKELRKNAGAKLRKANRVARFMSHQILEEMDGWEDDRDKLLHVLPIIGCCRTKGYYDPDEGKNVSALVLPQYLVLDPNAKSAQVNERASEYYDLYPHQIEERIRLGIFRDFDYKGISTETTKDNYQGAAENDGDTPAAMYDESKPHMFIEQHRRLDLDGDGYPEPYIVFVHKQSSTVARILPRFDRRRIKGDQATGYVKKIKPEHFYQDYFFMPDPEGSAFGFGFGHVLQHLNEGINTSINQLIDAGHRYVMGGGFIGKGLRMKGGEMRFKPGEYKRVDSSGDDIRKDVFPFQMPEPSVVLFSLMQFLAQAAEDISNLAGMTAGDMPANIAPTTMIASIEQGMQKFKAVFKRVHRAFKGEYKRLYELNQKYLTQEDYSRVMDDPDAIVEKDFDDAVTDIIPVSDPEMVSSALQRFRAAALAEWKDDPFIDPVELRKRVFLGINEPDVDRLVRVPPQAIDKLAEAQERAFNAQADSLKKEDERRDLELVLKIESAGPEKMQKIADAVNKLAQAEDKENAPNTMVLQATLNRLVNMSKMMEQANGTDPAKPAGAPVAPGRPADNAGGAGGMEAPLDDGQGAALPAPLPGANG